MKAFEIYQGVTAIIFDLDGTLADTMGYHIESWTLTGQKFNVPITSELINQFNGTPTIQIVHRLNEMFGWDLDPIQIRKSKNEEYQNLISSIDKIKPIEHVYQIAVQVKDVMPMCIGTGSTRENALKAIRDLGVEDWIEGLVSADDVTRHKPYPDTFLKCAEIMNVHPSQCQVFEDGPMGIEAAKAAGMRYVNVLEI